MSRERKGNRWTIKLCLKKLTVLGWILREDFISIIFQCRLFLLEENFFRYYLCRKWNEMENVENVNVSINLIVAYDNVFFLFTDFFNDNLFIIIFTIVNLFKINENNYYIYVRREQRETRPFLSVSGKRLRNISEMYTIDLLSFLVPRFIYRIVTFANYYNITYNTF